MKTKPGADPVPPPSAPQVKWQLSQRSTAIRRFVLSWMSSFLLIIKSKQNTFCIWSFFEKLISANLHLTSISIPTNLDTTSVSIPADLHPTSIPVSCQLNKLKQTNSSVHDFIWWLLFNDPKTKDEALQLRKLFLVIDTKCWQPLI